MHLLVSALLAWLPWLAMAAAAYNTRTEMRCQTHFAPVLPYHVATHTTTITATAPDITFAFTTRETSTLSPDARMTYTRTETSVSTITETVTEHLSDSTFSTTSTLYAFKKRYYNITESLSLKTVSAELTVINLFIRPSDFFYPVSVSSTSTTTSSTPPPEATPPPPRPAPQIGGDPSPAQVVYVLVDGKLVPTPLSAISSLLTDKPRPSAAPGADSDDLLQGHEPIASDGKPLDAEHAEHSAHSSAPIPSLDIDDDDTDDEDTDDVAEPESGQDSHSSSSHSDLDNANAPTVVVAPPPFKTPLVVKPSLGRMHRHPRRDDKSSTSTSTAPEPKTFKGIRGALTQSQARSTVAYPTMVTCTKSVIAENTVWRPFTESPTFVNELPVTSTITTLSILTVTSTVPDRTVSSTASFVTTSSITTTSTHVITSTHEDTMVYTVTSTRTSYQACATDKNVLGPTGMNETHIINVYSHGPESYTQYDQGFSTDAEACCVECHSMAKPCLGSIFTDGKCLLVTDAQNSCKAQGAAGYFVTRPKDDRPREGHHWPDYVISNGPCGAFHDAGTGW